MGRMQYAIGRPFAAAPTNEIGNGEFETDASGWAISYTGAGSASVARATDQAYAGSASLKIAVTGTPDFALAYASLTGAAAGRKGRRLALDCWVRTNRTMNVTLQLRQNGGAQADASTGSVSPSITANTWTHIITDVDVDENDRTDLVFRCGIPSAEGPQDGDAVWIDQAHAYEVDEGRVGGDFLIPARVWQAAGGALADYPVANLRAEQLSRTWRSDDDGLHQLIFDFGKAVTPDGIFIEGLNTTKVRVESLADLSSSADYSATPTVDQNPRTGRRGRLHDTTSGSARRFWRVQFQNDGTTPFVNEDSTFFQVGRISFVKGGGLNTLAQNWGRGYSETPVQMGGARRLPGGLVESSELSDWFMAFEMANRFHEGQFAGITAQLRALAKVGFQDRILHFRNHSDDTNRAEAYMTHRVGFVGLREELPIIEADMALEEVL